MARLADTHENFIGFKDGVGDIEHLTKVYAKLGDRLFYLGGLPTAETFALPLLQLGMSTYSTAMYNFVPEFALDFYQDVRNQDHAAVTEKLNELRHAVPGHPRPREGLRRLHRQGRPEGDRPLRRRGPRRRCRTSPRPTWPTWAH